MVRKTDAGGGWGAGGGLRGSGVDGPPPHPQFLVWWGGGWGEEAGGGGGHAATDLTLPSSFLVHHIHAALVVLILEDKGTGEFIADTKRGGELYV